MAEPAEPRVAVYIDFDNIVISRYNQLHGRGSRAQKVKDLDPRDADTAKRLEDARVDLGAVLDFASTFGTIAVSRAYADWSVAVNADYSRQLIERAVDLIQMFPTVASGKNGADIRLALDVAEDLFRLQHLTHVVIVAGDSDYIALAQRCKQLGRYVVGIGVAGSTSRALAFACDEFKDYDALPGVPARVPATVPAAKQADRAAKTDQPEQGEAGKASQPKRSRRAQKPAARPGSALLVRALEFRQAQNDDEWQSSSGVKSQMLRLDPTFQESALGFKSFTEFVQSLDDVVELDDGTTNRKIRLRSTSPTG